MDVQSIGKLEKGLITSYRIINFSCFFCDTWVVPSCTTGVVTNGMEPAPNGGLPMSGMFLAQLPFTRVSLDAIGPWSFLSALFRFHETQ